MSAEPASSSPTTTPRPHRGSTHPDLLVHDTTNNRGYSTAALHSQTGRLLMPPAISYIAAITDTRPASSTTTHGASDAAMRPDSDTPVHTPSCNILFSGAEGSPLGLVGPVR